MAETYKTIEKRMTTLGNEAEAKHLMRFFKTGSGEYGEGDRFLGIRVPATRRIVAEYRNEVDVDDVMHLIESKWHEIRLAGFLLMIEIYKSRKRENNGSEREIVEQYLSVIHRGNNWDLVDLVAPKILGDYLLRNTDKQTLLDQLAAMEGQLWHQRVAVVANWTIICGGSYDSTLRIVEKMLGHKHDLIHKACGWMLREVGKRGGMKQLLDFLNRHAYIMPRTMLRYAIERFDPMQRKKYMEFGRK